MCRSALFVALLVSALSGCEKKESDRAVDETPPAPSSPKPAEPVETTPPTTSAEVPSAAAPDTAGSWREVPGAPGLVALVSPDAGELTIVVHEVPAAAAGTTSANGLDRAKAAVKKSTHAPGSADKPVAVVFREWIKAEPTADGQVLTWEAAKVGPDGSPGEVVYGYQVRRKIGEKTYLCEGTVAKREDLARAEEACATLKEK